MVPFPPRPRLLLSLWTTTLGLAFFASARAQEPAFPEISGIIAAGTRLELIRDGFQGTEGPLAWPDGSLLFTETPASRITRITPAGEILPFLSETNGSNSLALRPDGVLISVQTKKPSVGIIYPSEKAAVFVDEYDHQPFIRPNDLVVDRHGGVYFTDPSSTAKPGQPAPPPPSVYYIAPDKKLTRLTTDISRPNGIQLSTDEKTLYVANTAGEYVFAFDVLPDGGIANRRDFARLAGFRQTENGTSSGADGLAIDANDRLYVASTAGIQIFSPRGEPLGILPMPKPPQNLAFAGPEKKTLYVVGRGAVYKIATQTQGYLGRAK